MTLPLLRILRFNHMCVWGVRSSHDSHLTQRTQSSPTRNSRRNQGSVPPPRTRPPRRSQSHRPRNRTPSGGDRRGGGRSRSRTCSHRRGTPGGRSRCRRSRPSRRTGSRTWPHLTRTTHRTQRTQIQRSPGNGIL